MENFSMILKSVVITLIIYIPIMMLFMKKGKFVSKSDELIEDARKEGRIVMGYLIKQELRWGDNPEFPSKTQCENLGLYEYTVNGVKYQVWQSYYDTEAPKIQSFYYLPGKPDKVKATSVHQPSGCQIIITILPLMIFGIVYFIIQLLTSDIFKQIFNELNKI